MRKQDYLLALIKSMDVNEKRHFKLFAQVQPGDKNYLTLYDALDGKEFYDAAQLARELNMTAPQLTSLKHYLAQVLLKSIRIYKDAGSTDSYLFNTLIEADELLARGLPRYALEIIDKALLKAKHEEVVYLIPKLLGTKGQALFALGMYEEIIALKEDLDYAELLQHEYSEMSITHARITKFEQSRKAPEEFDMYDHPILKLTPSAISGKKALTVWFSLMNQFYWAVKKDAQPMLDLVRLEAGFYSSNPGLKEFAPYQYVISQIRLVTTEGQAGNHENAWVANENLLVMLPTLVKKLTATQFKDMTLFANYCKASIAFSFGRYQEGAAVSKKVYAEKHLMKDYVQYSIVFDYAKTLMHLKRNADAIDKLDELLKINTELRTDLQIFVRPLMILAQLDLDNYQLVPYLIKSAKSWMKRRKLTNREVDSFFSLTYAIAKAPVLRRRQYWLNLQQAVEINTLSALDNELKLKDWLAQKMSAYK